jgi:hypothetical protein
MGALHEKNVTMKAKEGYIKVIEQSNEVNGIAN